MATVTNRKNTDELCPRFMLVRHRGLTGAGEERRSPALSGPSQVDAAAGSDGQEIPVSLVYDQVALAAKYSQQYCKLDSLLVGIEDEYNQSK